MPKVIFGKHEIPVLNGVKMNKKQKIINEKKVYESYHIPNLQNYIRRQKNCVIIHTANGKTHEMKKFEVCYDIQKAGQKFITEAQRNKDKFIIDVINITTGEEIEIVDTSGDVERYEVEGVTIVRV